MLSKEQKGKRQSKATGIELDASILVIGFVYWLVIKGEEQQR